MSNTTKFTNEQFMALVAAAQRGDANAQAFLNDLMNQANEQAKKPAQKGKEKGKSKDKPKKEEKVSIIDKLKLAKANKEASKFGLAAIGTMVDANDKGAEIALTIIDGAQQFTDALIDGATDLAVTAITSVGSAAKTVNGTAAKLSATAVYTVHDAVHVGLTGEKITSERLKADLVGARAEVANMRDQLAKNAELLNSLLADDEDEDDDFTIYDEETGAFYNEADGKWYYTKSKDGDGVRFY